MAATIHALHVFVYRRVVFKSDKRICVTNRF
nr:MAG TPA: hypothetical protein [Caudoviricetes sp.]